MGMGFWGRVRNMAMKANEPIASVSSSLNTARKSSLVSRAVGISKSVAGDLKTSGAALRMATTGAVGGAAGYYSGDGDTSSTLKGAALGVAGGAAWTASGNSMVRGAASEAWNASKSLPSKGWSMASRKVDQMAVAERNSLRAGRPRRVVGGNSASSAPVSGSGRNWGGGGM